MANFLTVFLGRTNNDKDHWHFVMVFHELGTELGACLCDSFSQNNLPR